MGAMPQDAYGLAVSTTSPDALATYDHAVLSLLGWQADALAPFSAAAAQDPPLALAHKGAAVCSFLEERFPRDEGGDRRGARRWPASPSGSAATSRPSRCGRAARRTSRWRRCAVTWTPSAMRIVQRLYYVLFWLGRFPEMLEAVTALLPRYPGNSFLLGMHAFALEEAGRCPEAVRTAETALALNPADAWAVHALAHALYESADFEAGIAWPPPAIHPPGPELSP